MGAGTVEFQDHRERVLNLSDCGLVHVPDPTHEAGGDDRPDRAADRAAWTVQSRLRPHVDPEC